MTGEKHLAYQTHGTCSRMIDVVIDENNIIRHVEFYGGCQGNSCGISKLVEGMEAREVVNRLRGITCGSKPTSCPDQLARALEQLI